MKIKQLMQDVDGEIVISIEKLEFNGQEPKPGQIEHCLCVAVGKHRKVFVSEIKKSFVIPFVPNGAILPDKGSDKTSCRSLSLLEKKVQENSNGLDNTDLY